jgi:3-deoxy-D-manno-octulosonic-acid transferase
MYTLYGVLTAAGFVLALPFFLWRARTTGKYLPSFRERMAGPPAGLNASRQPSIWIHAVSVGEVLTARTLLGPLRARFPGRPIFLSTTTLTGHGVAARSADAVEGLLYAPFDWRGPVRRALERLNPALLVILETELWPNLIHEARRRGVRIAVVNGRISTRAFPRYRLAAPFFRRVLPDVDLFLVQSESHAARFRAIGAPAGRVRVLGNLKYDAVADAPRDGPLTRLLSDRRAEPLCVAGSTVVGEEALVLEAFRRVRERHPRAALVLAPRHPERVAEVEPLITAAGLRHRRRSTLGAEGWGEAEVLLLDTMGELAQAYPPASVVFVGGSLVAAGGHNVLEPASAGRAIVVGPHMENFQEIADAFVAEQAMVRLDPGSAEALAEALLALLGDAERRQVLGARARALVDSNRGARERTLEALGALLA